MHYLLFTTTTCPKCPAFKAATAAKLTMPGRVVTERDDDFRRLADEYTVSSVPTIIVFDDPAGNQAVLRTSELAELHAFAAAHAH